MTNESKKKVLIVDDDRDFVESTKDVLEASGYAVSSAPDGRAGMALAKKEKPDLMILDIMMTRETEGIDMSRDIASTPELKAMKVLMVTGIRKAMKLPFGLGPDDTWLPVKAVLEKPVPPGKLIEHVKQCVG